MDFYALLRVWEVSTTRNGKANFIKLENLSFLYDKSQLKNATFRLTHFKHSKCQTGKIVLNCSKHWSLCPVWTFAKYANAISAFNTPLFDWAVAVKIHRFTLDARRWVEESRLDSSRYTTHSRGKFGQWHTIFQYTNPTAGSLLFPRIHLVTTTKPLQRSSKMILCFTK